MKKVCILLLLTTVIAAFSFAQVKVVGGFEAGNVTEANKGNMDPAIRTEFHGAASKELGPGSIGAELGLGTKLHLSDKYEPYDTAGDIYLKGSYTLPAGPGELAIGISTWPNFSSLAFGLDYNGIAAGPATIGLGVGYTLNTSGKTDKGTKNAIFGDERAVGTDPVQEADDFAAKFSADFDFGLGIAYEFHYNPAGKDGAGEDTSGISKIVYLDVNYQVMDPLVIGLELDDTGDKFKGFQLKPYGNYSITDNTTLGIYVKVAKINSEEVAGDKTDIEITPGLKITHSF
ncbi:MAG: hypothetical protein LBU16_00280 [Treponema sp.]|jgi:hypothetical protein|nr:hypothetical protein [Treponema sp.]